MEKRNRNVMILSIVALVLVLVGVTYAYFSAQITGIESASTISMTAGRMSIVYTEGDENVTANNIYPREEEWITKVFTLTGYNTTNEEMYYNVGLNVETNGFANGYLTYDLKVLESDSGTPVSEKTGAPINGTGFIKFGKGSFKGANGDKHKYELKIYFKDNGLDQNDAMGAAFNAKISVVEYMPKKGTLLGITSYDINKTKCLAYVSDKFDSEEDKETYCNDEVVGGTKYNISDDVSNHGSDLVNLNIIENVVYDDNNNITSYTINKENCIEKIPYPLSTEDKNKYCSGETIKVSNPDSPAYSIASDIANGKGNELKSAGVIENTVGGEKQLVPGDKYVDGQYTYIYGAYYQLVNDRDFSYLQLKRDNNWDHWSVELTNKESTEPVTTELCTSINGKTIASMTNMFADSQATSIDLSSFNTSNVTSMGSMFEESRATSVDLSSLDTSNVTDMSNMFAGSQATSLDLSTFDTSNVTNMQQMFSHSQATSLDLSSFDTSNVTNMKQMFSHSQATSLDLSSFDTSNVTDMLGMFNGSQATTLDLSTFDTSNVTNMGGMFLESQATTLDLSSFDTSNVTSMDGMFSHSQTTTLDLSSFDTSKVTYMKQMFQDSANLTTIYVSDRFDTTNLTLINSYKMFTDCTSLVGGAGTTYNSSYVDKAYAHIDGGTSNPGYFTRK